MDQFGHATAMEKLADDVSFLTSAAIFWWFAQETEGTNRAISVRELLNQI